MSWSGELVVRVDKAAVGGWYSLSIKHGERYLTLIDGSGAPVLFDTMAIRNAKAGQLNEVTRAADAMRGDNLRTVN